MKTSALKLKKLKTTRVYGFKQDLRASNPFIAETTPVTTTATTTSSRVMR